MRRLGEWIIDRFVEFLLVSDEPEVIGNPECPLMYRWTVLNWGWAKVLIHHFAPNTIDADPHDHPRSFVTFVVAGEYVDLEEGPNGKRAERMSRGAIAYRSAQHMHRVHVSSGGAWTVVIMGRLVRPWGFLRGKVYWPWKAYIAEFGGDHIRCDEASPPVVVEQDWSRPYKGTFPPGEPR